MKFNLNCCCCLVTIALIGVIDIICAKDFYSKDSANVKSETCKLLLMSAFLRFSHSHRAVCCLTLKQIEQRDTKTEKGIPETNSSHDCFSQ